METMVDGAAGLLSEVPSSGDGSARLPASTILRNVSHEIARCADMAFDLQDAFASVDRSSHVEPDIGRMQSLDLLEQMLRDLSHVTALLARCDPLSDSVDVSEHCKLDDVARRLQGRPVVAHSSEPDFF